MSGFAGLRVLVVEDEPVVAMCLEDMLDMLGCVAVGPAGRLAEGLVLAREEALDAAILDINLAGERSTEIAEALRDRGIPFAFASGYGAAPDGFEDPPLIEKPYREGDIAAALQVLLDRSPPTSRVASPGPTA
jgi:CheY-like chemotaxis protein